MAETIECPMCGYAGDAEDDYCQECGGSLNEKEERDDQELEYDY